MANTARAEAAEAPNPIAKAPAPVVDARFPVEVLPGVFLILNNRIPLVPDIGIIVGTDKVLLVYCGLGLSSSEAVLNVARDVAPGRDVVVTVTHAHPEHGFGAVVFQRGGKVFYNAAQKDYVARAGSTLLDGFRNGWMPPDQLHLLEGIELSPPDEIYDGQSASLDLGGRSVEFRTWGTAHSPGDQIVYLPDEGIVFAGDLIEERMFPIVPYYPPMIDDGDIDVGQWSQVLADIVTLNPRLSVPGHGALGGVELATKVSGYFDRGEALVQDAGGKLDGLDVKIRNEYPTWENVHFIDPALQYFSL